ncbi:hypothetical protein [Ekhidna sp.]|uniref:hypothetical protein n=1 Tax=Ekhidna sp. TaxID=2608089 RepID=UPI003BAA8804
MEKENLHLLINEEIYLLPQDKLIEDETLDKTEEVQESTTVAEPEPELLAKQEKAAPEQPKPASKEEPEEVHHQESPHIPHHDLPDSKPLPFAVFHTSHAPAENELLHKILDACKVPESDYKIFSNGFDQSVMFKKALVFVPEAKAFYTPIPYKGSEFLCSKPLDQISGNVQEKAKLWAALQKFVDHLI